MESLEKPISIGKFGKILKKILRNYLCSLGIKDRILCDASGPCMVPVANNASTLYLTVEELLSTYVEYISVRTAGHFATHSVQYMQFTLSVHLHSCS